MLDPFRRQILAELDETPTPIHVGVVEPFVVTLRAAGNLVEIREMVRRDRNELDDELDEDRRNQHRRPGSGAYGGGRQATGEDVQQW